MGLYEDGRSAFLDMRITNTNAPTALKTTPHQHILANEQEKRRCYSERISVVYHGDFVPIISSHLGGLGPAAEDWLRRVTIKAHPNRDKYAAAIHHNRLRLQFAVLRGVSRCLRASRHVVKPYRSDYDHSSHLDPEVILSEALVDT